MPRPTLLLADDSVTVQRVIELTFANEDVQVIALSDGRQAIQKIDLVHPDIVLADVGMPVVDGYAVSAHVKASPALAHIPVLLLTGAFEPLDEAKARASGCDGVLVKPFEPQQLVARVRELLARREPSADRPPHSAFAESMASVPVDEPSPFDADHGSLDDALGVLHRAMPPPSQKAGVTGAPAAAAHWNPVGFLMPEIRASEPLEPSVGPVWDLPLTPPSSAILSGQAATPPMVPRVADPKVTLAESFTALLAAERAHPSSLGAAQASALPEAVIEEVVARVLQRLTAGMVRTVVADTVERLMREEIDQIKTQPK